jgi:hypothetical protein
MEESTLLLDKDEAITTPGSAARLIREVKYKTRKRISSEDKIRIVPSKAFDYAQAAPNHYLASCHIGHTNCHKSR